MKTFKRLLRHWAIALLYPRPLQAGLPGLAPLAGDIQHLQQADASVASLSCLHVIEHIGLGRYGDAINPQGSLLAAAELQRILQPGGRLYLSVPVGRERVCFNAHRVFAPDTVLNMFADLQLKTFSLVDDQSRYFDDCRTGLADGLEYGCGMFCFMKIAGAV